MVQTELWQLWRNSAFWRFLALHLKSRGSDLHLGAETPKSSWGISALGQIKSKLSDFKEPVDEMRRDSDINGREPTITHPSEDKKIFTAEASNSALRGSYEIAVSDLASGSRIETADAAFSSSNDAVLTDGLGDASMTFKINNTGDSFAVTVKQGMTLAQLREAINNNADNFGVNANIIDTGTASGAKLVISSSVTGLNNDLMIVNDGDRGELVAN